MNNKQNQPDSLRAEAEARLARAPLAETPARPAEELLHELRVHQIELDMQNEALRQAQIAMEESRDRYVDLYDFAPIGYLTLTHAGQITEVNLTGAALLGVERNKLLHRRFDHFVIPEDQDRWQQHFLHAVQHGERQGCELSLKRGDGSVFHAHLDCLHVGGGNESSVRIALTDITESKRMEESQRSALLLTLEDLEGARKKIEHSHQEWMAALDVVNDPIFLHDKLFRILRCNKAYQQCAGIPFHEIIGQLYYEIFPKIGAPLPCCLRAMEKAEEEEEEEEVAVGEASYRSRAFSIKSEQGAYLYSVHTLEDITEHKQAEAAFHTLVGTSVANVGAAFFHETVRSLSTWLGVECVIVGELVDENRVRALAMQLDGKAIEHYEYALPGTPCDNVAHKGYCAYPEGVCQLFPSDKDLLDMGAEAYVGTPIRDKNGKVIGVLCAISRHKLVLPPMVKGVFEIIASRAGTEIERKRAIKSLEESEQHFRAVAQSANDAIITITGTGNIMGWNAAAERLFGYTGAEIMRQLLTMLMPERFRNPHKEGLARVVAGGVPHVIGKTVEVFGLRKDGSEFPLELSLAQWQAADGQFFTAIIRDITERKQAEQELIKSRQQAQHYLDIVGVMLISLDVQGRVQMINRKGCEMLGHSETDILGKDWFDNYLPGPARNEVKKVFTQMMDGNVAPVEYFENDILTGSGDVLTVAWHNSLLLDESGKINGVLSSGEDITERKQAEAAIAHANRALAALSAVNRSLVRADSEDELLQSICHAIVRQHGYQLAWVGYVQHDENKSIKIMAYASDGGDYPDTMQPTWAEEEHGMGPGGRAVRSGTTQLCQDIANDPHSPWRDEALKRGYAASIALPLLNGDKTVFGTLTVYAAEVNAFIPGEISLLEEMAGDMAFGVRSLRMRQERDLSMEQNRQQLVQLQDSLEDTMRAIASIIEMRDPYTAGHQARVADLSVAIARQMGLPDEQVHAIHLAGTVHDLGKIQIPAEILSKPGKITDLEFSLIKIHPQAGYDILKGIDFPWPIAQMVLQHHERLDGSGYPQGLKGDAILLEARILSVADVVEAMSSHRPYRPGLGIEVALAEIIKQRGIYYDPQAVDACLVLFREQHYSFK